MNAKEIASKLILTPVSKYLRSVMPPVWFDSLYAAFKLKYWPNIKKPRTFNEYLLNIKHFNLPANAHVLADKNAVRDFVAKRLGDDECLVKQLYCGTDISPQLIANLPKQFIIKFTHTSGNSIVVEDKDSADWANIRQKCGKALEERFGHDTYEDWYLKVPPQIVIEELLVDKKYGIPVDYKFFVFNGRAEFIQVDYGRFTNHTRTVYSRDWHALPIKYNYSRGEVSKIPALLPQAIQMAEKLASGFQFVRVDLYLLNDNQVKFGEMTFAPEAGYGRFEPRSTDFEWGRLLSKAA